MCCRVRLSLYFFAKPKSIRNNCGGKTKTWKARGGVNGSAAQWRETTFICCWVERLLVKSVKRHVVVSLFRHRSQSVSTSTFQWLTMWVDIIAEAFYLSTNCSTIPLFQVKGLEKKKRKIKLSTQPERGNWFYINCGKSKDRDLPTVQFNIYTHRQKQPNASLL